MKVNLTGGLIPQELTAHLAKLDKFEPMAADISVIKTQIGKLVAETKALHTSIDKLADAILAQQTSHPQLRPA